MPLGRDEGWAEDLRRLVTARERFHREPWHGIGHDEYVGEVEAVVARIPDLSDDELMVETVRLAAMPTWAGRDGHGGIHPWAEGTYPVHMLPIRLYWFTDGAYVVDAIEPHTDLLGRRVEAIGGHSIGVVMAAVEPLVPRDNHQQVLALGVRVMTSASVLHGLGLIDDPTAPLNVTLDGEQVQVQPVPRSEFASWPGSSFAPSPPIRPNGAPWISRSDEPFWWEWDPDSGTAFIQYNQVVPDFDSVVEEVRDRIAAGGVERVVLDLRHNGGGNNGVYQPWLTLMTEAGALGFRPYVIMGRATFSAAGNLVTELEQTTDAILVGEDSGTSPNQYGDSVQLTLEHSGLVFRVAPDYIVVSHPDDDRITIEPDLPAPLSSADYFADRDPAMEAILADS